MSTVSNPQALAELQGHLKSNAAVITALFGGDEEQSNAFRASCVSAYIGSPTLQGCTAESVFKACFKAARLRLVPGDHTGHAWLIKRGTECVLQLGYRGVIVLLGRCGILVVAGSIHENDWREEIPGEFSNTFHHKKPEDGNRGPLQGAFAKFRMPNGVVITHVSWRDEIDSSRNSSTSKTGPWATHESEMGRRTALVRGAKYLPIEDPYVAEALLEVEYEATAEAKAERKASRAFSATTNAIGKAPATVALPSPAANPLEEMRRAAQSKWAQEVESGRIDAAELSERIAQCETQEQIDAVHLDYEQYLATNE